jgi:hypothetical protein
MQVDFVIELASDSEVYSDLKDFVQLSLFSLGTLNL